MIEAKIIADSINPLGNRITTMLVTFPRIILSEFNTHRMFSRNSASSRAIPFKKMVQSVTEHPFVPIAWQKDHKGMQGTEYFSKEEILSAIVVKGTLLSKLLSIYTKKGGEEEITEEEKILVERVFERIISQFGGLHTLEEYWLMIRDKVVEAAILLHCFDVSKQICNRLLEPFMYHTVLVTATEWENFFALRCPRYDPFGDGNKVYRSWRDITQDYLDLEPDASILTKLKLNKGQAEIHMMALAEAMWDTYNESIPNKLEVNEWHIPFNKQIIELMKEDGTYKSYLQDLYEEEIEGTNDESWSTNHKILVSSMMSARISYTVVGEDQKPWTFEKYRENGIKLQNTKPLHASPLEHCAKAIDDMRYTKLNTGNFTGWVQYRKLIPNENITK